MRWDPFRNLTLPSLFFFGWENRNYANGRLSFIHRIPPCHYFWGSVVSSFLLLPSLIKKYLCSSFHSLVFITTLPFALIFWRIPNQSGCERKEQKRRRKKRNILSGTVNGLAGLLVSLDRDNGATLPADNFVSTFVCCCCSLPANNPSRGSCCLLPMRLVIFVRNDCNHRGGVKFLSLLFPFFMATYGDRHLVIAWPFFPYTKCAVEWKRRVGNLRGKPSRKFRRCFDVLKVNNRIRLHFWDWSCCQCDQSRKVASECVESVFTDSLSIHWSCQFDWTADETAPRARVAGKSLPVCSSVLICVCVCVCNV